MDKATKIKVACLCFAIAGQAFWFGTMAGKSVQPNCDIEAADQAWQHAYGGMNATELAAGAVLEPTGESK